MAYSAMNWVAPQDETANDDCTAPTVLPVFKPLPTRRVGTIKAYSPQKRYGLVEVTDEQSDAIFEIDDVSPCDQSKLGCGQTVTFLTVHRADGLAAKDIRIDLTTLPPLPNDTMQLKGWR